MAAVQSSPHPHVLVEVEAFDFCDVPCAVPVIQAWCNGQYDRRIEAPPWTAGRLLLYSLDEKVIVASLFDETWLELSLASQVTLIENFD